MKKFFMLFFMLVFACESIAEPIINCATGSGGNTQLPQQKTLVMYVNGVGNGNDATRKRSNASLRAIQIRLKGELSQQEYALLDFKRAYNPSNGLLDSMWEAAKQKIIVANTSKKSVSTVFLLYIFGLSTPPQDVQDSVLEVTSSVNESTYIIDAVVDTHVGIVKTAFANGLNVVEWAHSQGNFYVIQAYARMSTMAWFDPNRFGVLAIASPASFVPGGDPYTRLLDDEVIGLVSALSLASGLPLPLPSNVQNAFGASNGWSRHGFLSSYFVIGTNSEAKILADFRIVWIRLVITLPTGSTPPPNIAEVAFTIESASTISTPGFIAGAELHIQEPNGLVVSSSDPNGLVGSLTETTGSNRWVYTAGCENLEAGVYTAGFFFSEELTVPPFGIDAMGTTVGVGTEWLQFSHSVNFISGTPISQFFDVIISEISPDTFQINVEYVKSITGVIVRSSNWD
ncbi:MAG TPA: hypothetical protein ENI66_00275 [Candidatus Yonathbacteria bacterium]|nr:hypothetical protein [Candidatus Yonathbacteria bacterium]